ncbi:hypothetical protein [Aeromicrobium sp. REDSEA-S32_B7]|uniref:hypothetical protein n=1 Tax=Aeromicrobium sp. REDSEA-S32_B7 TaxID=1811526 RepID=UPI000ACC9402|nr:hypothetical protein [Aeromicrobium sp. REDSEA-S32_B7]
MTSITGTTRVRGVATTLPGVAWVPCAAGVLAALLRMTWADRGLGSDEAGFLAVAGQWSPGTSLYGHYWVDRPPLLITLYQLADGLGGAVGLRVVGALAVLVAVVTVGAAVRRATGSATAAAWTGVVAGALLASPAAGAYEVNGELLAAPFTALGVLGVVLAWRGMRSRDHLLGGGLAGAGLVAALLVKQNMVDVLVVAAGVVALAAVTRTLRPRTLLVALAGAAAGGVAVSAVVLGWAALHGTSPGGVWYAMYPFRVAAGAALASSRGVAAHARGLHLLGAAVVGGVVPALAGAGWAAVSIAIGGNFWTHYLVQLALPLAVGVGLVSTARPRLATVAAASCLVPAVLSATVMSARADDLTRDQRVGQAIGAASVGADSLVVAWGHPGVVQGSGLTSPYPSLWSLPTKTLDPDLTGFTAVLAGPRAPTWVVTGRSLHSWGLHTHDATAVLHRRYRRVADVCGSTVYLRDGLARPVPAADCG